MTVNKIEDLTEKNYEVTYTMRDLENEFNAYILLKIVRNMFQTGLITDEEKHKIEQKIVDQFTPYLSEISAYMT